MMITAREVALLLVGVGVFAAPAAQSQTTYPILPGTTPEGRAVWLGTCESCHAYGIAGSPDPADPEAWRDRLDKPMSVLYEHAIDGFFGPEDTQMPPRGGNPELSDEQVKSAVDYMAALASRSLKQSEEKE